MHLTPQQRRAIQKEIDDLYYNFQAKLLGRFFKGPKIYLEIVENVEPADTIEGMFRFAMATLYGPNAEIDKQILRKLAETTRNYLDSARLRTRQHILADVEHAHSVTEMAEMIQDKFDKASNYIEMLVTTELRNISAAAEKDGINQVAADMGIDDPNVCKVGVKDGKTCKVCKKLWWKDYNRNIPRVYRLSELRGGYNKSHKPELATPTVAASHPHCRCVMTFVPPGFGFDDSGRLMFKGLNHDEQSHQRKLSED